MLECLVGLLELHILLEWLLHNDTLREEVAVHNSKFSSDYLAPRQRGGGCNSNELAPCVVGVI